MQSRSLRDRWNMDSQDAGQDRESQTLGVRVIVMRIKFPDERASK